MTPDVGTVRAEKRQNRALQSGSYLLGPFKEGFSAGYPVINEVVLEGKFSDVGIHDPA